MAHPSHRKKLWITVCAPLVAILGLEGGLRVLGFERPYEQDAVRLWNANEDRELRGGHGLHAVDLDTLWAPRPGAALPWGDSESVNEAGYRGPLLRTAREPDQLRIAFLGESTVFGVGLELADTAPELLRARLAEHGVNAEVLNAGVVGFTAAQGLARYQKLVRPLGPDVLIVAFGVINESLPSVDYSDVDKIALSQERSLGIYKAVGALRWHSRIVHFLASIGERSRTVSDPARLELQHRRETQQSLQGTYTARDWPGERRVSPDEYEALLLRFCAAAEEDGTRLIFVSMARHPDGERDHPVLELYSERLARVAEETGTQLADVRDAFDAALEEGDAPNSLFLDYWHYDARGQALFAETLLGALLGD